MIIREIDEICSMTSADSAVFVTSLNSRRLKFSPGGVRYETLETTQFYIKKKTRKTYFEQMPD